MKILYFAWVRQKLGTGEETLGLPAGVATVADLARHLAEKGGAYAEVFADLRPIKTAVNQMHAGFDTRVREDDEIAFFPPVTGG